MPDITSRYEDRCALTASENGKIVLYAPRKAARPEEFTSETDDEGTTVTELANVPSFSGRYGFRKDASTLW